METVFINPERCIGCLQCELACAVEHSASKDEARAFLETPVPRKRVHVQSGPVPTFAFPNRCRHCDPAPCLKVCPSGAISRDTEHGLVLIDEMKCIGCAMCAVVCPFDVLTFHPLPEGPSPDVAVAVKCDGCIERVRDGGTPACVEVCKVDALVFGELNDLLAAGRVRETGAVLAAAGAVATASPGGDPLAVWHMWGIAEATAARAASTRAERANAMERSRNGNIPSLNVQNEGGPR
jgi:carbon-monoxide dehydrogenase iron sulfur subunit